MPTASLDAFIAGAVAGHFATDPAPTLAAPFPGGVGVRATEGLVNGRPAAPQCCA